MNSTRFISRFVLLLAWIIALQSAPVVAQESAPPPSLDELCVRVATDLSAGYGNALEQLRTEDPDAFRRRLAEAPRLIRLARLLRDNPKSYEHQMLVLRTDQAVLRLAREARSLRAKGRHDAARRKESELRDQLRRQIELALQSRDEHLCHLQAQVDADQVALDKRLETADERVADRVAAIVAGKANVIPTGKSASAASPDALQKQPAAPLTSELIESCLAVAREIWPDLERQLVTLRDKSPDEFHQRLRSSRSLVSLGALRLQDPNLYDFKRVELQTDVKVAQIAQEIRDRKQNDQSIKELEETLWRNVLLQEAFRHVARLKHLNQAQTTIQRLQSELESDRQPDAVEAQVRERLKSLLVSPPT